MLNVPRFKTKSGIRSSNNTHAGNNAAHTDAGKLKILKIFCVFCTFVIIDYFLTIFNIHSHLAEFNPLVVFIFKNFAFPEIIFLFFKISVIGLNLILLLILVRFSKRIKLLEKIAFIYIILALIFSIAVVIYDIGIILGIQIPIVNDIAMVFFKTIGML